MASSVTSNLATSLAGLSGKGPGTSSSSTDSGNPLAGLFAELLDGRLQPGIGQIVSSAQALLSEKSTHSGKDTEADGTAATDPALAAIMAALSAIATVNPKNGPNSETTSTDLSSQAPATTAPTLKTNGDTALTAASSEGQDLAPRNNRMPHPEHAAIDTAKIANAPDPDKQQAMSLAKLASEPAAGPNAPAATLPSANFAGQVASSNEGKAAVQGTETVQTTPLLVAGAESKPAPAATPRSDETMVRVPLHSANWNSHFAEKVVWLARNDQQSAQINIAPPQLGPIQITLNLSGDQASAVFASPHAEVRQAIESAMPQLRDMLASAGINLGDANVGSQLSQQNPSNPFPHAPSANENAILPAIDKAAEATGTITIERGRGMIDLFA